MPKTKTQYIVYAVDPESRAYAEMDAMTEAGIQGWISKLDLGYLVGRRDNNRILLSVRKGSSDCDLFSLRPGVLVRDG